MIRVIIIFSILAYLFPGVIVARAFYTETLAKYRRQWKRQAKDRYPGNTARQNAYYKAHFSEDKESIQVWSLVSFLLWPIFLVVRFINSAERARVKRIQQLELKLLEVDQQIEIFRDNLETMRILQKEREAILDEIETLSD